jgi:glutathione peroxidase
MIHNRGGDISREMIMHLKIAKTLCLLLATTAIASQAFGYQEKAKPDAAAVDMKKDATATGKKKDATGKKKDTAVADKGKKSDDDSAAKSKDASDEKSAYNYNLPGPDGKDVPVASFKGKVVLVVNLARNSSYNSQLPGLIKLSETYKSKGLVIVGIPSNDFGAAEPGTDQEIQKVYTVDNKVPFPVMARSVLIGEEQLPFYTFLTKGKGALAGGDVHWNYTKFILGRNGKPVVRLNSDVAPDSPEMLATLDEIFAGTYKPKKEAPAAGAGAGATNIAQN